MAGPPYLEWRGIGHAFGRHPALRDVNVQVARGALCCVMGPNGAGKTTLLKIAAGLIAPSRGRVCVLAGAVGLLLGDTAGCYAPLSARENLRFFAALAGLAPRPAAARIESLITELQIETPDLPFQACASGMKQRVLLARALLNQPPLLLLDEPSRHLDAAQTARLHGLLRRLQEQGTTIVMTTHQAAEARQLAQQTVLLRQGRIQEEKEGAAA